MNSVFFNIYDYKIKIESSEFSTDQLKINYDFEYFSSKFDSGYQLYIRINRLSNFVEKGFLIGRTFMCEVRQVSYNERQLIYREKAALLAVVKDVTSSNIRQVEILAQNQQIIDDILYFLIHSCVGEHLDCAGLVRIHALSYKSTDQTSIVYGPSGSGKSTLALNLLNHDSVKIYSDEITILDIKNKVLLPYPIRIATADFKPTAEKPCKFTYFFNLKNLIPIEKNRIASETPLTNFYCIADFKKPKIFYFSSIMLGFGLIQMWEYLLRLNNLKSLLKILINRIKLCLVLNNYTFVVLKKQDILEEKIRVLL